MRFIWDPEKEARNKVKHGLDFSFAELVFADPLHAIVFDRTEDGEERRRRGRRFPSPAGRALLSRPGRYRSGPGDRFTRGYTEQKEALRRWRAVPG
ncbi:MAG: BrnT family toxin [Rhodopila sp.]